MTVPLIDGKMDFGLGAVCVLKDRFRTRFPHDFDSRAKPYTSVPSSTIQDATTDAINDLGLSGEAQEYSPGDYWISSTISPSGGSADDALAKNDTTFRETTINARGTLSNYQQCFDQATGNTGLNGLNDSSDNLPTGETTRVVFDVTNTEQHMYHGALTLDGDNMDIALMAGANRHGQNGFGAQASIWDTILLRKAKWGMFGTPRYGQARNFYCGAFVGWQIRRLRMAESIDYPMLMGANQCDDINIGELNLVYKAGAASYLFGCMLNFGTGYVNGGGDSDYGFHVQESHLKFDNLYAEFDFAAVIHAQRNSWVEGTMKYGAGAVTSFGKRAFLYNDDISGGGVITAHDRSRTGSDAQSMILLKAKAASSRNYWINAPYKESDLAMFKMEAGTGTLSTNDKLISFSQSGLAKWTPAGTSAAPTLTRGTIV